MKETEMRKRSEGEFIFIITPDMSKPEETRKIK